MEVKSLENFLDKFGQRVVDKAQAKLYKEKGNTALGQSIRFEVVRTETGFSTKFYMLDYGTFLDKGVSGNKKKRSYKNYKGLIVIQQKDLLLTFYLSGLKRKA